MRTSRKAIPFMNMITAFLKARVTSIRPTDTKYKFDGRPMIWPVKVASIEQSPFSGVDESIFLKNTLVVPRAYGQNAAVSDARMDYLSSLVRLAYDSPYTLLSAIARYFTKIEDGGTFWDVFIYRHNGDTPIAIFEHVTALNIVASELDDVPPSYYDFVKRCVEYGKDYDPAIYNNHLSWKAIFMATSAFLLKDEGLMQYAEGIYRVALNQIEHDGTMPQELMRGEKALRYSIMNLEALNAFQHIYRRHASTGCSAVSDKLIQANKNLSAALRAPLTWANEHGLPGQRVPGSISDWNWAINDWAGGDGKQAGPFAEPMRYEEFEPTSYINHYRREV
jgi:hypothetical protein